jgi:ABC-type polysaccharide/polyol phosphate transport system ATPase subunit
MFYKPVIVACHLNKTFQIYKRPIDRLKQMMAVGDLKYHREFVALRDCSFELGKGEVLGLVGRNGAGKSTLLQLICGTLTSTSGSISVHGRIAALLELGAGFNPEFTGRENIYLNASILGLDKAEIDHRYDAIVDFSGIADFIDQPVKTYSSGMYVRLAFSIATSVDPDILVIDEALSVGDGAFARKSFDRIMHLKSKGATILFCSHSMYQIEALCTRALWLEKGIVQYAGDPAGVVARYQSFLDSDSVQTDSGSRETSVPTGHARILKVQIWVDDATGTALEVQSSQQTLAISMKFASDPELPAPVTAVSINGPDGRILSSSSTQVDGIVIVRDEFGRGTAMIKFPKIPLLKGEYFVWAYLLSEDGIHTYDTVSNAASLHFRQQGLEQGLVSLVHSWSVEKGIGVTEMPVVADVPPSDDPLGQLSIAAAGLAIGKILTTSQSLNASTFDALAIRLGLARTAQGDWYKQRQPRWLPSWVRREHQAEWLDLFEASFGYAMQPTKLEWKYKDTEKLGVGVWDGKKLIAFYGGLPRSISYLGRPVMAIQIGDVMVHPSQRGVLTRSGPFQIAAASFLEQQIGHDRPYLVGFGFPTDKALRLANKLGLYAPVDSLTELRWPAVPGHLILKTYARPVSEKNAAVVDELWLKMKHGLQGSILGVRTGPFCKVAMLCILSNLTWFFWFDVDSVVLWLAWSCFTIGEMMGLSWLILLRRWSILVSCFKPHDFTHVD